MKRHISIFALLLSAFAAVGTAAEATTQTVSGGYYYVGEVYADRNVQRMSIDGKGVSYAAQNLAEGKSVTFKASPDKGMEISDWGTCVGDRGGSLLQKYTNVRWEQRTLDYYDWSSKPSDGPGYLVVRFDYKKFVVTFDINGGTSKKPDDIKGQIITSTIPLPSVTRDGYEFAGWKNAKGDVFQAGNTSGEAFWNDEERKFYADLTAQWTGGTYAVTINPGAGAGGECDGYTVSDQAQTRIVTPPTQEGHTIQSWQVSGATGGSPWVNEENVLTIPANTYGNLTLTPTWKADTFTITYKPGSGTPGDEHTDTKTWGVSKSLRDKTYEDPRGQYVQDGWNTTKESFEGAAEYGLKAGYTDNASITLYPHWKLNGYKLTIHHKGAYYDGKLLEETALEPLVVGTTNLNEILVAVPTNGAAFYGYYSTEGGNTKIYDEHGKCCKVEGVWSAMWPNGTFAGNANLEVWAKWGPPPEHCTIRAVCDPTDGGTVEPASTNVVKGKDVTLTATKKDGYSFCCWTNSNGVVVSEKPEYSFTVTADATYTAVFTGNVYTVTFVAFDGDPAAQVHDEQVGENWVLPAVNPPAGKVLDGWYGNMEGTGEKITSTTKVDFPVLNLLYAKFTDRTEFDVIFVDKGGGNGAITNKNVATGTLIAPLVPTTWTRKYYTLVGWNPPLPQTVDSSDLEFTAVWWSIGKDVLDCPNLDFEATGNWKPSDKDDTAVGGWCMRMDDCQGTDNLTATLDKPGTLTFNWKSDGETKLRVKFGEDEKPLTFSGSGWKTETFEIPAAATYPLTLQFFCLKSEFQTDGFCAIDKVTWEPGVVTKKHTVTFIDPSGTIKTNVVQEVEEGSSADAPSWASDKFDPTTCGWSKDFSKVMEDIEVSAVWTCRVSFVDEEGGNPTETKRVEYNESVTAPQWSRTGYTFGGWNPTLPEKVTENTTVKAVWTPITHKVTFRDKSGTFDDEVQIVNEGQGAMAPKWTSEKFDPTTCGWDKDFSKVMENITVGAVWTCRVVFVDHREGGNASVTNKVEYGKEIAKGPDFTVPDDYHFGGWDPALPLTALSNTTVSVIWTQDDMYTVTFHDPSKTFADVTQQVISNKWATEPAWSTNKFESLAWDKPLGPIEANTEITAVWTCKVEFVDNEYGHSVEPSLVEYGKTVTAPVWEQTGYTLKGWQPAFEKTASSNSTYAAVWAGNAYTVTFDANGGSVSPSQVSVTYGQPYGTLPTPAKADSIFLGWFLGGVQVESGTIVSTPENHSLTAKWKQNMGPVSEALDCNNLVFNKTGDWSVYTNREFACSAGNDSCLKTSVVDDGTGLTATIRESGTLSFYWKAKTPDNRPTYLTVWLDDERIFNGPDAWEIDWQSVKDIPVEVGKGEEKTLRFECGFDCEYLAVDCVTWTPDGGGHPEPVDGEDNVTISSAAVSDGKFSLSFKSDAQFDYNLRTNANLMIDSWGIMETLVGDGSILKFEPEIIEGQPQLFYKVETIQKK